MTKNFIDSANLSKKFADAIAALKAGDAQPLYDLAGILDSIAEVTGEPVHYILPQTVGGFGSVVIQCRKALAIPYMHKDMKDKLAGSINRCVTNVIPHLEAISEQMTNHSADAKAMLDAIGSVQMEAHLLLHDFRSIVPSRAPGGPEGEE